MNNLKKNDKLQRRAKRLYALCVCLALTMAVFVVPAFAAPAGGDPLDVVNNLSEFIFSLIRAVGLILLGYGILQVGLSLQSQLRDAAEGGQRKDTEADRVQDTARMSARLAVDKLGRLALGKKKARSWSGEASEPQVGSDPSAPGTQAEPSAGVSSPASQSGSARAEMLSTKKTVRETHDSGKRFVRTTRSERASVGKSRRQRITSAVDSSGQATKAADRSTRATRQVAHANLQARQRAVQAAGGTMRTAATVDRPVAKAATSALRGAVSAIRTAMAPPAAGGGAVIAVVLVLCLVAALIMSPLGILFSSEETGGQTIADVIREINQEYSAKLMPSACATAIPMCWPTCARRWKSSPW